MKKIIFYLTRSTIDLTLLLIFLAVLIRSLVGEWWRISPYIIAGISFAIIYILGVMWRSGAAAEIMNEYIRDDATRLKLGLNIYSLRNRPIKLNVIAVAFKCIFFLGVLAILIFGVIL